MPSRWHQEPVHIYDATRLGRVRMCDRKPIESVLDIAVMDYKTRSWMKKLYCKDDDICIHCSTVIAAAKV